MLNLVGAFLSVQVAKTISGGLVNETEITPVVVFAGLVGAILWNLLTWLLGLPSSSSHALFGGLIGASSVVGGLATVNFDSVNRRTGTCRGTDHRVAHLVGISQVPATGERV